MSGEGACTSNTEALVLDCPRSTSGNVACFAGTRVPMVTFVTSLVAKWETAVLCRPEGNECWVTDVHANGSFSASKPRLRFKLGDFAVGSPGTGWDISLDGQHFLMVKFGQTKLQPVTELIPVQNWFEELKRLAPTTKK
jgi:hypothetical protein